MIPFARIVKYGNHVPKPPTYSGVLNMQASVSNSFKDLVNPMRQIDLMNAPTVSTAQFLPGCTSSFNFRNGYISIPVSNMADMNIGKSQNQPFTIEYYAYVVNSASNNWYLSCGTGTTSSAKHFSNNFYIQGRGGTGALQPSSSIPTGVWRHFALVWNGTSTTWYVNGVRSITFNNDPWGNLNTPLRIGGYEVVSNAWFDQIRITNSALYSGASFTPPVPPLN